MFRAADGNPARRRGMPWPALFLLTGLVAPLAVGHATPEPEPITTAPANPEAAKQTWRLPGTQETIAVDGRIDEPAWAGALVMELPFEVNPGENLPAAARTEALLLYGDEYLYAAFRVFDPEPAKVRARYTDRDTAFQDDFVGLVLDTFNDERRAYEFFVNPLGVQMDLVVDDVGGSEDSSWDAIWASAGMLTAEGYQVEMAIPLHAIRFQSRTGEQTWGIDLVRVYPRDKRYVLAAHARDRNISCYLCQVGKIVGFEGATPGRDIELTPTLTAIRSDAQEVFPDGPLIEGDADAEVGLSVRWGMTPNLALNGTINPDFSQVEADVAQLDVNEQFALFFPEKRPFFLEGADFFSTPLQAVYTRTVADPDWGAKLTGKAGRHVTAAFVAEDAITNLLFPGSQSSSGTSIDDASGVAVLRYRGDVGENASLGALLTARAGDDYSNTVLGVDGLFRPRPTDTVRFQLAGSRSRYPDAVATDFEQPAGDFTSAALFASYTYSTRKGGLYAEIADLGRDFRADLGFMPQVDILRPVVSGERAWWGDGRHWYSRIAVGGDFDQTEDQSGALIEREWEGRFVLDGPSQWFLFVGPGVRQRGFRDEMFDQTFLNFETSLQPLAWLRFGLFAGMSDRVDFDFVDPLDPGAARQGDEVRLTPSIRLEPGRHVRITLFHDYLTLSLDEGELFRAGLTELRATWQINLRMFLRVIAQYSDVKRNPDLYPACADPGLGLECPITERQKDLFAQLLLSYKINPLTALYVGYTDGRLAVEDELQGLDEPDLIRTSRTFFMKIGRAWIF